MRGVAMMKPEFREVLLQVWREVGRHLEIQESCATITRMLAQHFPLQSLIVRRFDASHHSLQTVAMSEVVNVRR
jgi:hypothetical protein